MLHGPLVTVEAHQDYIPQFLTLHGGIACIDYRLYY